MSKVCDNINMQKQIMLYNLKNGKEPFDIWLSSVKDKTTRAKIKTSVLRMSSGNYGDFKKLSSGICELRLHFGSGYRIYFSELDKVVILLLCGGDKSSQTKDIEKAVKYLKDYKELNYDENI